MAEFKKQRFENWETESLIRKPNIQNRQGIEKIGWRGKKWKIIKRYRDNQEDMKRNPACV